MKRLFDTLGETVRKNGQKTALVVADEQITYTCLWNEILAWCLWATQLGMLRGDRILVISRNCPDLLYLYFAASRVGITLIFLYDLPDAVADEWEKVIADASPDWIVYNAEHASVVDALAFDARRTACIAKRPPSSAVADRLPTVREHHEPLLQMYTSGTTGTPKGVCVGEEALITAGTNVCCAMKLSSAARVLLTGYLYNTTGSTICLPTLLAGGTVVFPRFARPDEIFAQVEEDRITHLMLNPYAIGKAIADPQLQARDLRHLVMIAYGAAPIPPSLIARARALLPCDWLQGYGLTETCGVVTWLDESDHQRGYVGQSCGRPSPFHEVRIVDSHGASVAPNEEGEILVRGQTLMDGYWERHWRAPSPWDSWSKGWFCTGDVGALDDDGYLKISGRKKEAIVTAKGFTIYAHEVEQTLSKLDGRGEVALLPWQADPESGEIPVAVLRSSSRTIDCAAVRSLCQQYLSREKWPTYVVLTTQPLPRNANGKVQKHVLRDTIDSALRGQKEAAQNVTVLSIT